MAVIGMGISLAGSGLVEAFILTMPVMLSFCPEGAALVTQRNAPRGVARSGCGAWYEACVPTFRRDYSITFSPTSYYEVTKAKMLRPALGGKCTPSTYKVEFPGAIRRGVGHPPNGHAIPVPWTGSAKRVGPTDFRHSSHSTRGLMMSSRPKGAVHAAQRNALRGESKGFACDK